MLPRTDFKTYVEQNELYRCGALNQLAQSYQASPNTTHFYSPDIQDATLIEPNPLFQSKNQNLAGAANPKTTIAPVNVAPILEWNVWKQSDFQIPNQVNRRAAQDFYQSGYYVQPCSEPPLREDFTAVSAKTTDRYQQSPIDNYLMPRYKPQNSYPVPPNPNFDQNTNPDYMGQLNTSCNYTTRNSRFNLPVNYDATNCQQTKAAAELNDELFTSYVDENIFYKNDVIEPVNYNIGISFTQQIPPRAKVDINSKEIYTAMDPLTYKAPPVKPDPLLESFVSPYDVYDPRSDGYGASNRDYVDELTGQPRFYYDDVEAIRRPNFVNRSKIDHLPEIDTYGPVASDQDIFDHNRNVKQVVEKAFVDQTLQFRDEMQTRLLRKRNAEIWQNRLAPFQKGGNFTLGGMNRIK